MYVIYSQIIFTRLQKTEVLPLLSTLQIQPLFFSFPFCFLQEQIYL